MHYYRKNQCFFRRRLSRIFQLPLPRVPACPRPFPALSNSHSGTRHDSALRPVSPRMSLKNRSTLIQPDCDRVFRCIKVSKHAAKKENRHLRCDVSTSRVLRGSIIAELSLLWEGKAPSLLDSLGILPFGAKQHCEKRTAKHHSDHQHPEASRAHPEVRPSRRQPCSRARSCTPIR